MVLPVDSYLSCMTIMSEIVAGNCGISCSVATEVSGSRGWSLRVTYSGQLSACLAWSMIVSLAVDRSGHDIVHCGDRPGCDGFPGFEDGFLVRPQENRGRARIGWPPFSQFSADMLYPCV